MRTSFLGHLDINEQKLRDELRVAASFQYSDAYSDYLCGGAWRSCMLWAAGGVAGDGLITNYDHGQPSVPTPYGESMPYLSHVVAESFDVAFLNFARLAAISNTVIIPHRDLLELEEMPTPRRNAHRFHIPLATNDACFFAEDDIVFRMRFGEAWSLDAARPHSAASFSSEARVHLILDFVDVGDPRTLVKVEGGCGAGIPDENLCRRPPLPPADRDALLGLAAIIDMDNYRDVLSIVIRSHFRFDGGPDFVWATIIEIARRSAAPDVIAAVAGLHRHFLITRSTSRDRENV